MKAHTKYFTFNTPKRRTLVRITDEAADCCKESGIKEWVQKLAPGPAADDRTRGPDYRHHHSGEDNGDAHLKNLLIGHQVIVPITKGRLDLGPWQQIFYYEFDGRRDKRMVLKVLGE